MEKIPLVQMQTQQNFTKDKWKSIHDQKENEQDWEPQTAFEKQRLEQEERKFEPLIKMLETMRFDGDRLRTISSGDAKWTEEDKTEYVSLATKMTTDLFVIAPNLKQILKDISTEYYAFKNDPHTNGGNPWLKIKERLYNKKKQEIVNILENWLNFFDQFIRKFSVECENILKGIGLSQQQITKLRNSSIRLINDDEIDTSTLDSDILAFGNDAVNVVSGIQFERKQLHDVKENLTELHRYFSVNVYFVELEAIVNNTQSAMVDASSDRADQLFSEREAMHARILNKRKKVKCGIVTVMGLILLILVLFFNHLL